MISVIVNVYNGEKYIKKCLDSIINQTYKDIEILIVNDGSTDATLKVCKKYKDKRIRIITQDNIGISLSRNVGIENSRGNYLFFVDCDDYIEKDTIEYLYNLCIKNDVTMAICQSVPVFDYNYQNKQKKEHVDIVSGEEIVKKVLLNVERNGNIWGKLMRRDVASKYPFEDRIISDVAVIHKMCLDIDRIAYSNQVKYYYYKHSGSIVSSKTVARGIDFYEGSLERYDYIKKKCPNMIENDLCILWVIVTLYGNDIDELNNYLDKKEARKLYKKMFTFKLLFSKLKFNDKVKMILYRISPKIYRFVINSYLKIRKIK